MTGSVHARPNLVLFMPDQLRADAVGAFGNPVVRTPNIDALAARGTIFTNAYSQHSVCSPSRVSIMTGWYPHTAGHRTLTHLIEAWEPNLLALLREAGYHVAWAGHRGDTFAPGVTEASTDFCGFLENAEFLYAEPTLPEHHPMTRAFYTGRRPHDDVCLDLDEATIRTAEQWLAGGPPEPWVLFCALLFPHPPFEVEEPWFSLHDRDDVPMPVPPTTGKAAFVDALRDVYGTDALAPDDWREIVATYYGMVARVDDQLGRVLRAVENSGYASRTATLFFTDHGEFLGDYGLVEKWPSGLDDCLLRNPLVIDVPGGTPGQRCDALVEMVDVLPTLLDLAQQEAHHTHFGRSLVPLLADASREHRDAAFSEGGFLASEEPLFEQAGGHYAGKVGLQHTRPELVGKACVIRTAEWTYVHRLYEPDELYDRVRDPQERRNVAAQADLQPVVVALRNRILQWFVETGDVIPWDKHPRFPPIPNGYRAAAAP